MVPDAPDPKQVQLDTNKLKKDYVFTFNKGGVPSITIPSTSGVANASFSKDPRILLREAEAISEKICATMRENAKKDFLTCPMVEIPEFKPADLSETGLAKLCFLMDITNVKLNDMITHLMVSEENTYLITHAALFSDLWPLRSLFDPLLAGLIALIPEPDVGNPCRYNAVDLLELIGYILSMSTWMRDDSQANRILRPTPSDGAKSIISAYRRCTFKGSNQAHKLYADLRAVSIIARSDLYSDRSTTAGAPEHGSKHHETL